MFKNKAIRLLFLLLATKTVLAQPGQIAIPRISLMPDEPAPFSLRDWRQVALRQDSFIYDVQKTGQYLPLSAIKPAGVNYPQNPAIGLHTYVGTNSPTNAEAINVLPSLVGASLVGANKMNQFGQNWAAMSLDFFNKNGNAEGIYLNSPSAQSGSDWWYDLMPNVFFYQLFDLNPGLGAEAEVQFLSIADQFSKAVRTLGGSESPWQKGNFDYRAFKFKTGEPNAAGVHEPEAAGAFAWVLFNAWKKTGNPDYLKAAEWAIEFLDEWPKNPSYELQLPYGTLTAAKMNAQLGTDYDVEKMLNWSFDRGDLRGWGTIVGKWGGLDASGLVGEANDAGNDYAFQLNGVQQAAALVPMVRYDKRFARAIGKWMLNLTNATRLFYPGFLPVAQQDAAVWSAANDPQQVVGYEALREKLGGFSPFSTGDALGGGWAGTNLAIYGSGSIGYLGAMVEKTNVPKILKIDVLKTDFYHDAAFPTFLFYNPYSTAQAVEFNAGAAPADIYEATSETFILQNASGSVLLSVPAKAAILVTVCPAGGAVSFSKNEMRVAGVVVDFRQNAQPFTFSPRIKGLAAAKNPLEINQPTAVFAAVEDADSNVFSYEWSLQNGGGSLAGSGPAVNFTAPPTAGNSQIRLIAADPEGNRDTAFLTISIVLKINVAPQIIEVQKSSNWTSPGGQIQLNCLATDSNGDVLTFNWTATGGSFSNQNGPSIDWTAPPTNGIFQITATVLDDGGLSAATTFSLLSKDFSTTGGGLVADYPFSGNANDVSGNALNGLPSGVILTVGQSGAQQSAYYFNGGAQHIAVANSPLLNFEDGITVAATFKANALPAKESFLLSHGSWQNRWKISITPEKKLRWTVNTLGGIGDVDSETALVTDQFYCLAATCDGSLLTLWLDGKLVGFRSLVGKIRTTTLPFLMGQMLPGLADYNFKGVLDAVKIWDGALGPVAIETLCGPMVSTGEATFFSDDLAVFPNPTAGRLTVSLGEKLAGETLFIQLKSLDGRLLFERKGPFDRSIELDVSGCPAGAAVLILTTENGRRAVLFFKID